MRVCTLPLRNKIIFIALNHIRESLLKYKLLCKLFDQNIFEINGFKNVNQNKFSQVVYNNINNN